MNEEIINARDDDMHMRMVPLENRGRRRVNNMNPEAEAADGWGNSMIEAQCSAKEIATLYEGRWAIDIRFRALKGSTRPRELFQRKTNKTVLQVLLTAVMIFAHIGAKAI